MKTYPVLVAIFFTLSSGFAERGCLIQQQASIAKAVALIKLHIDANDKGRTNITIVNSHNGRYTITSSLSTEPDCVTLVTHVIDMMGNKRDTTIILEKRDFLFKLERASYPANSVKFAGHHQKISVTKNGIEEAFDTVDGRMLMNLLEYGE
jgi:hypothetical protein